MLNLRCLFDFQDEQMNGATIFFLWTLVVYLRDVMWAQLFFSEFFLIF